MAAELIQVQLAKPERKFIKVYVDFYNCKLLTNSERTVYISLKSFLNYGSDVGEVFPSLDTLAEVSRLDVKTVKKAIKGLEKKGAIKKERRGLTKSNLYTLNDIPEMWQAESEEEMKQLSESKISLTTEEMIEELQRRGAIKIVNEKEPISDTDQSTDISPSLSQLNIVKTTSNYNGSGAESQERYSMEWLKDHYNYEVVVSDRSKDDTDTVFSILYDALNTTKDTIRVNSENKPREVVISKLLKIDCFDIEFVIDKYNQQRSRIKKAEAYILTQLYKSKEQSHLDLMNEGHVNGDF